MIADIFQVKELTEELVAQANQVAEDDHSDANGAIKVPPELRKAKVTQVMGLLEREFVAFTLCAFCMKPIRSLLTQTPPLGRPLSTPH